MNKWLNERVKLLLFTLLAVGLVAMPGAADAIIIQGPGTSSDIYNDGELHIADDGVIFLDVGSAVSVDRDLKVNYPIYAMGNQIWYKGDAMTRLDFNRSGSRLLNYNDLYVQTDDYFYVETPIASFMQDVDVTRDLRVRSDGWFSSTDGTSTDPDLLVDGYARFNGTVKMVGTTMLTDLTVSGTSTFNGTIDANSIIDVAGATITGNLVPSADATYDLGASGAMWRDLYLSGNTINIEAGSATIAYDGTNDSLELDGATVSIGDDPGGTSTSSAGDGDLWVESGLKIGNGTTPNDFTQFDTGSLFVTGAAEFDGTVRFDGVTDFNAALDTTAVAATITGHLIPTTADTYNLGSTSAEWANLYIADGPGGILFGSDQDVTAAWDNTAAALEFTGGLVAIGDDPGGATATGANDLLVAGDFEVDGTSDFDGVINVAGATVTGHLIPSADDTYDLGSSTAQWRDLYLSGNTINIGDSQDVTLSFDTVADAFEIKGKLVAIGDDPGGATAVGPGDLIVSDDLEVDGDADIDSMLNVAALATFDGGITAESGLFSVADTTAQVVMAPGLINGADDEGVTIAVTASDTGATTTSQIGLLVSNLPSTEAVDALLAIENNDLDDAVGVAIEFYDAGGGFTNLFDVDGTLITPSEFTIVDGGVTLGELTNSGTLTATTVDINGGAIDGTTIGATTPSSGAFTTLTASGDVDLSATGGSAGDPDLGVPGYALFTGTLDVNGAADFSGGLTNSAGELLVSGGNAKVNDDLVLSFGTGDNTTLSYDAAVDAAFEIAGTALVSIGDDPGTSVTATGAGDLLVTDALEVDGATDLDGILAVAGDATFSTRVNLGAQTLTVTDDGVANDTLTPTTSYVKIAQDATADVSDPDLVLGEGSATDGDLVVIVRTDANAGNVTISDSAGVSEIGATETFGAGEYDTLILMYVTDRWVQVGGAQN